MDKKKHQVVVFMTGWCPHCKTMRESSWIDQRVLESLKSYHGEKPAYVLCDKAQNRPLVEEFDIEKYPTVVIMDEDHNIRRRGNNMSPDDLLEFLETFNG
jgi:thiol-disulfide isomerase/thioredoxin